MSLSDGIQNILGRIPYRLNQYPPPAGWEQIVIDLDAKIAKVRPDYDLVQVKEKFGGLRYYVNWSQFNDQEREHVYLLIAEAEALSYQTCETCGKPGRLREQDEGFSWMRTLCDQHAEEHLQTGNINSYTNANNDSKD